MPHSRMLLALIFLATTAAVILCFPSTSATAIITPAQAAATTAVNESTLCEYCFGRGTIQRATSVSCVCECNRARDPIVAFDAPNLRAVILTEPAPGVAAENYPMMPPHCRYLAELETIPLRIHVASKLADFTTIKFLEDLKTNLKLKYDDQLYFLSMEEVTESLLHVNLYLHDDGTGSLEPPTNVQTVLNVEYHFTKFETAVASNVAWVQALKISKVEKAIKELAPAFVASPQIGLMMQAHLSTLLWLSSAALIVCLLISVECCLSSNFVLDDEKTHYLGGKIEEKRPPPILQSKVKKVMMKAALMKGLQRRKSKTAWRHDDDLPRDDDLQSPQLTPRARRNEDYIAAEVVHSEDGTSDAERSTSAHPASPISVRAPPNISSPNLNSQVYNDNMSLGNISLQMYDPYDAVGGDASGNFTSDPHSPNNAAAVSEPESTLAEQGKKKSSKRGVKKSASKANAKKSYYYV